MSKSGRRASLAATLSLLFLAIAAVAPFALAAEDEEKKPKHTTKEVMEKAMKGGLLKKVAGGEATEEEKKELLDMFISLVENKPPRGEMESWHNLAGASALAAAKMVVGRDGAADELKAATNCKACHSQHKPEE
ncbi:MAG: hypothetical protein NXI32_29200 [bacterium]|nr:hypothetical protein [bacterium]